MRPFVVLLSRVFDMENTRRYVSLSAGIEPKKGFNMSNNLNPESSYDFFVADLKANQVKDEVLIEKAIADLKSEDSEVRAEAKNTLVNSVSMYAVQLVNKQCAGNTELRKEAIQEALISLYRGIDNFNPERAKFLTFAGNYLRKGIHNAIDAYQFPGLTHNYVDNIRKVDKFVAEFERLNQRSPSDEEISAGTKLSLKCIGDVKANRQGSSVTNIFYEEEFVTVVDVA